MMIYWKKVSSFKEFEAINYHNWLALISLKILKFIPVLRIIYKTGRLLRLYANCCNKIIDLTTWDKIQQTKKCWDIYKEVN